MPLTDSPPPDSSGRDPAKQKFVLKIVIGFLVLSSILIVTFAKALPLPARLFVAATDLVVAAALWLVLRQKFSGK